MCRKDPFNLPAYLNGSIYLADVNNERTVNAAYRQNLASLNSFTMLYSTVDNIVTPKESGWFEFFADGSHSTVVPLRQTPLYTEDRLGLRTLDERGALHMYACDCRHQDYPEEVCKDLFDQYTLPLLDTTAV